MTGWLDEITASAAATLTVGRKLLTWFHDRPEPAENARIGPLETPPKSVGGLLF